MENSTRNMIKSIAYKLFEENGYDQVTIKDICHSANIGKTTFYYYFKSKEDLIADSIEQPEPMALDLLSNILSMESYWEQIWYLSYCVTSKTEEIGYTVFNQVIKSNLNENKGTFDAPNNKLLAITLPIVEKAQAKGELLNPSNPENLLLAAWAMHTGLYTQWCIQRGNFNLAETELKMLEIVFQVDEKYRFTLDSFKEKYNL